MRKTLEEIEVEATEDLLSWEEENDRLLPFSVDEILAWEERGYIVDLETGAVTPDRDQVQR